MEKSGTAISLILSRLCLRGTVAGKAGPERPTPCVRAAVSSTCELMRAVYTHKRRTRKRKGTENRIRSEEHTSELQSLMRISYAVFCLKNKTQNKNNNNNHKIKRITNNTKK